MKEIVWHGRGGQGVVVASSIFGTALAIYGGKYALSIPSFGGQRRDAPLIAVTRVSEEPIRRRDRQADPDYIVILDDSLVSEVLKGLSPDKPRHIIVNSKRSAADLGLASRDSATIVDAAEIASKVLKSPITNTVMVGVFAAASGLASLDSLKKAITDVMPPEISQKNIAAAEAGFTEARSQRATRN